MAGQDRDGLTPIYQRSRLLATPRRQAIVLDMITGLLTSWHCPRSGAAGALDAIVRERIMPGGRGQGAPGGGYGSAVRAAGLSVRGDQPWRPGAGHEQPALPASAGDRKGSMRGLCGRGCPGSGMAESAPCPLIAAGFCERAGGSKGRVAPAQRRRRRPYLPSEAWQPNLAPCADLDDRRGGASWPGCVRPPRG